MKIYKVAKNNEEYFYHATFLKNIEGIIDLGGFAVNKPQKNIGTSCYDFHKLNHIFASKSIEGTKRWIEKLIEIADQEDDFIESGKIPVALRFSYDGEYLDDEIAISEGLDDSAVKIKQEYNEYDEYDEYDENEQERHPTIGYDIEIWSGNSWIPIEDYEQINFHDTYFKMSEEDDFYYINDKSKIFNPQP